jgi:hypothetical protein
MSHFVVCQTEFRDPNAEGTVSIIAYDCSLAHNDKIINKAESCEVVVDGAAITIHDSGGVGTRIAWTVTAAGDGSGNIGVKECELVIQKLGN